MDAKSSNKTATLTVGNKTYDFPIYSGTVGPDVLAPQRISPPLPQQLIYLGTSIQITQNEEDIFRAQVVRSELEGLKA